MKAGLAIWASSIGQESWVRYSGQSTQAGWPVRLNRRGSLPWLPGQLNVSAGTADRESTAGRLS
jgi:hypothetical protein